MGAPELLQRVSPSGPLYPNDSVAGIRQFERVRTDWEPGMGPDIGPVILTGGTVIPMEEVVRIGRLANNQSRIMLDWALPLLFTAWDGSILLSASAEISPDEGANWVGMAPILDDQEWPPSVETVGEPTSYNDQRVHWFGSYTAGGLPANIIQAPTIIARVTLSVSGGAAAIMIAQKGSGHMTLAELSPKVAAP